ncbi:DUF1657 domain-containing protein [Heliobacterium chlorum]|uniref:DUF1657 domain-containing protein n=1 Tax=Heliobacterium chlorum TaxID=2698 RepID=A0ABR7T1A8_HELCL|nr:DUF1657 domain-containing protein [Heliobacterium chlorum]MBC9784573.1 DUF1657 domain-containing protein [Heliobacterium chlorum]
MTVASQVKGTIASLKGARATLETFTIIEENQEAKDRYAHNLHRLDQVIGDMEKRLQVLEYEEPQYKGF